MDEGGLEGFAEEEGALDDLKAEGFVDALGEGVGDGGVGGEFAAAVGAGPAFGGAEECGADALAALGIGDIPAFDVTDRVRFVAAFGVGAEAHFEETRKSAVWSFGDEDGERQSGWRFAGQNETEFLRVFHGGGLRPESVSESGKGIDVGGTSGSNDHGLDECLGRRLCLSIGPNKSSLAWFGPIGEAKAGAEIAEGLIAADECEAGRECVGGHQHVHGGETPALLPGSGGQICIGFCGSRIPGQRGDTEEKLIHQQGEFCSFGLQREAEKKLSFRDAGDTNLRHGYAAQAVTNDWRISSERVTYCVGVQQEARHTFFRLEEATLSWRATVAGAEEVGGDIGGISESEEVVPGFGFAGEDDVAGFGIFADIDFRRGKTEGRREPNRLAPAVFEEFGDFVHDGLPPKVPQNRALVYTIA
jgi:hypothetical protein